MITQAKLLYRQRCLKRLCRRESLDLYLRKFLLLILKIAWVRFFKVIIAKILEILILYLSIFQWVRTFFHTAQLILTDFIQCSKDEWLDKLAKFSKPMNYWAQEIWEDQLAVVAELHLLEVRVVKLLYFVSFKRLNLDFLETNLALNLPLVQLKAKRILLWTSHLTYCQPFSKLTTTSIIIILPKIWSSTVPNVNQ